MVLGTTWKEVKVKSGVLKVIIWVTFERKQHCAVAVGNHWPKERQWFRNLFFFKIISHRMASLGHRCKPLGFASSVSSVLVSRTKKRKKFCIKNSFASPGRGVGYECSLCRTWSQERELETVAVDVKVYFPLSSSLA